MNTPVWDRLQRDSRTKGAALWLLWDGRRLGEEGRRLVAARLPAALILVAGVALAIAPATLRNYLVEGEIIPISSQAGITFYQGNNEKALQRSGRHSSFACANAENNIS